MSDPARIPASLAVRPSPAVAILAAAHRLLPDLQQGARIDSGRLRAALESVFGGSDAEGLWDWKTAYEALEAATVLFLHRIGPALARKATGPAGFLGRLDRIARLLPTHTRRSEESQALQQFSTPPGLAFVAATAAAITPADLVLEPSAGTGLLAVFAALAGAGLHLNELADTRAELLAGLFPGAAISRHDAAHIDDFLEAGLRPSVVLMNPPFTAGAHVEGRVADAALRHIRSALARLADGGRLVAITGANFAPDAPAWAEAFVALQERFSSCLYCVVDQHAITADHDPKQLAANSRDVAAAYLAAGVDPKKSIIFVQSAVREHTELAWVFNCVARMGWLERMTQFKDKAGKHEERVSVGLFDYPVLMAADILLYKATHVPVGEDQKQHLELSRDIAQKFNNDFGAPDFFPLPDPLIQGPGARIMSLRDGTKKMSKSDESDASRINLTDDADTIANKIKRAKTDMHPLPDHKDQLKDRPEAENLLNIFAALSDQPLEAAIAQFAGQQFSGFKTALADLTVAKLAPINAQMRRLLADPAEIDRVLTEGARHASAIAAPVMEEVKRKVGFLP